LLAAKKRQVDLIVMSVHRSRAISWSHLPWPVATEVTSLGTRARDAAAQNLYSAGWGTTSGKVREFPGLKASIGP
jgi:hypothetical protein